MQTNDLISRLSEKRTALSFLEKEINSLEGELQCAIQGDIDAAYKEKGDLFGVVNIGDLSITTPKKVTWDQAALSDLYHRIAQSNENPLDYIKLVYDVSETKYNAWPEAIRDEFSTARTIKPGKIKITIKGDE